MLKKIVRIVFVFIIAFVFVLPAYAATEENDPGLFLTAAEQEYVASAGTIRVGLNMDRPPFCEYDAKADTFTGINVDILEELAATTGLKFKFIPMVVGKTTPEMLNSGNMI